MCGIVSIINTTDQTHTSHSPIELMNATLHHRGPDDRGIWVSPCRKVQFGHNRLSIIDLTEKGAQPMISWDDRYVLIFNGEIYNYPELQAECIQLGSQFYSQSDSEVILESYRHWGTACLTRFRGMWAFLLYDIEQQTIFVARDPFAIKPLYYSFYQGQFYFASEIKALTVLGAYFQEEDPLTTKLFLEFGYLDRQDWTFYKNIKRFSHAHSAMISLDTPSTKLVLNRYWSPLSRTKESLSFTTASRQLKEVLTESMRLHLRSDVPVGACLSGGLDSSAIVCLGSQLSKTPFSTFTTSYPNNLSIDETPWARQVIDHTQAKAYFTEPNFQAFQASLDDLIRTQDEPFGSMSIFAQYFVFKRISETSIKVVLDGQGADELLGGYLGFIPFYFEDLLKRGKLVTLFRELFAFKALDVSFNVQKKIGNHLKQWCKSSTKTCVGSAVKDEFEHRLQCLLRPFHHFEDRLEDLLVESNIPQLLRYEDRNSMRFSIESRVPFLDTELVHYVLSLPAQFRIRRGYTKAVLREALKGIVPENVRLRRSKLGFPAPEMEWLQKYASLDSSSPGGCTWRNFIYQRWSDVKQNQLQTVRCYESI